MFKHPKAALGTAKMSGKDVKKPKQKKQTSFKHPKQKHQYKLVKTPKQKLTQTSGVPAQKTQMYARPKPKQFKTLNRPDIDTRLSNYMKGHNG